MAGLVEHGQALQHVLGDLSTLAVRDLVQLFNEHSDGEKFPDLLRKTFGEIVRPYAHAAAVVTARWYHELWPHSDYRPTPIVELPDARIDKTVDWAVNARTTKRVPGDLPPRGPVDAKVAVPNDVILGRVSGSSQRMINDASRTTVVRNAEQEGVKWARLAAPDACAFCKVMALRGAVYNSYGVTEDRPGMAAASVHRTVVVGRNGVARGKRKIGESYHDCCRCVAVPVRKGAEWKPPDYVADWLKQYRDARKAAGGATDLKKILAEMRAAERARRAGVDATDEHELPPVDLDEPAHV